MRPDKISVYDLFDRQRRYAVPLYQRQYVWTMEGQWMPLWEDISDKARLVQQGEAKAPHFLGAIVTSQRQVYGNELNSWEIIDGQQRLTTLQIFITAFHNVMKAAGELKYDRELQRITRNEGLMKEPVERFKVWPTNSDRAAFVTVMDAGSLPSLIQSYPGLRGRQKRKTPRLAEAYAFFYRAIERFLNDEEDGDAVGPASGRADALFETFRRYLQIVNIELETGDDPQVIFESLNGRGVPLLPSDLVRNFVFMRASNAGANLDALYDQYWRPYDERVLVGAKEDDEPWWKQVERQGRLNRARLDLFLFHYLQFRLEREVNIGHLFQEFRNWWDRTSAADPSNALAEMQTHANVFASWIEPDGTGRVSEFSRWLKALDTSTLYPVMFFLLVEQSGKLLPSEIEGIVEDLESYLVRRTVCGLTNKQYNRFFVALLKKLRAGGQVSRAILRSHLASGQGNSVRWPSDEEFGRAFIHRPAYRTLKREVVGMLLLCIERGLSTSKHEQIEVVGKLSIEHVMPQEWQDAWPLPEDSEDAREQRERLLHAFGNLTLVTPGFNTALSNKSFSRKQKELRRIARLLLSRGFENLTQWDEKGIVARGRQLFDEARRLWPHPASPEKLEKLALELPPDASWSTGRAAEEVGPAVPPIEIGAAITLLDQFANLRSQTATVAAE